MFFSSDPGRDKVVAPILKYKNSKELAQPSAILLSMEDVLGFFSRYDYQFIFEASLGLYAHMHVHLISSFWVFVLFFSNSNYKGKCIFLLLCRLVFLINWYRLPIGLFQFLFSLGV